MTLRIKIDDELVARLEEYSEQQFNGRVATAVNHILESTLPRPGLKCPKCFSADVADITVCTDVNGRYYCNNCAHEFELVPEDLLDDAGKIKLESAYQ